jgi:hypothetical protein
MEAAIRQSFQDLGSQDDKVRYAALQAVLKATDCRVNWAYDVWNGLVSRLSHDNSYQRSIAVMTLCNLAKSDSENRLAKEIDNLLRLTNDEKFVTSRQCMQSIWKVAVGEKSIRKKVTDHLSKQYVECVNGKHHSLIRQDIIQSLRNLFDSVHDETIRVKAMGLIKMETEAKNRKKYETYWKDVAVLP